MPLSPNDLLDFVPRGDWRPPKVLTITLLVEAHRAGLDVDTACEAVGAVIEQMGQRRACPRTLFEALDRLRAEVEARRPF